MDTKPGHPNGTGQHQPPRPTIWVCGACGKRSHDRYGYKAIDGGWDESCMLNSFEVYADKVPLDGPPLRNIPDGAVVPVEPPKLVNANGAPIDGPVHLSLAEQGVLHRALLRSARIVPPIPVLTQPSEPTDGETR